MKYDEEVVEMVLESLELGKGKKTGLIDSDEIVESKENVLRDLEELNDEIDYKIVDDFEVYLEEKGIKALKWEDLKKLKDEVWNSDVEVKDIL